MRRSSWGRRLPAVMEHGAERGQPGARGMVFGEEEQDGDDDEGEDGRGQEAADDDPGHGAPRLGARGHGERGRQHADDHRDGRHEDRLQADLARLDDGVVGRVAAVHERQRVVEQERAVLRDDAIHDEDADQRVEVQRVMRQEKDEQRADDAERQ